MAFFAGCSDLPENLKPAIPPGRPSEVECTAGCVSPPRGAPGGRSGIPPGRECTMCGVGESLRAGGECTGFARGFG